MRALQVEIEINGVFVHVGTLHILQPQQAEAVFAYDASWLARADARPISVSLPLCEEPFSAGETRNYFEGLLPEGFTRECVAQRLHAASGDYLSVLAALGKECLGALKITETETADRPDAAAADPAASEAGRAATAGLAAAAEHAATAGQTAEARRAAIRQTAETGQAAEKETAAYRKLTVKEVEAFAAEGASKSAELVTKSHLSLTGASGKAGLYFDETSGAWYLPLGSAPSTHIVKQSHVRLKRIVENESLCLRTARKLGIETADHFIFSASSKEKNQENQDSQDVVFTGNEGSILFAAHRYDRFFPETGKTTDGLRLPRRLHQEDFAQALGIGAAQKYEKENSGYLRRAFALLRNYSADPIRDQLKLWDICIFNFLIGNTDNHIKNLSLLYNPDLRGIRLAPAYDIVSTMLYESSTEEMALFIGGENNIFRITKDSFAREAADDGLGVKMAMRRFDTLQQKFPGALREAGREMEEEYPGLCMEEACEQILNLHKDLYQKTPAQGEPVSTP